jgi:tRNA/rRNA methyltransferase
MTDIVVAMIEPESQGNIGAIARAMKNFGLKELYLVNPKDSLGDEARKMAVHAQNLLDNVKIFQTFDDLKNEIGLLYGTTAIAAKRPGNLTRNAISPSQFAELASSTKGRIAVLFGRESTGLSNRELEACDAVITIPSNQEYPTLNVAMAGVIIFYELSKVKINATSFTAMDKATKFMLISKFKSLTFKTNLPAYKRRMIERAFRNVIGKGAVTQKEAGLVLTALNRIEKKIELLEKDDK